MSIEVRVEEWLRKMGYDGQIPSSLFKICNPSTAFIWEQLITNVRPRQEVELKKRNLIVNRLSKKSLEQQDEFSYPIREIEVLVEKRKLEKRIEHLERTFDEKEEEIDDLLKKNNVTYIMIDNVKAKIKEMQERTFLLEKKSQLIKEDIQHAQESLTMAKNLTPVEMEGNTNTEEITKTLQRCAEKLQKLSKEVCLPKTHLNRTATNSVMRSARTPRYSSKVGTITRYLDQSTLLEIAPSAKQNKENIKFSHNGTVSKCLKFTDDVEEGDKKKKNGKTPKRESLGLLPDSCFNTSDDLDALLLSPDSSVFPSLSDSLLEPLGNSSDDIIEKLSNDKSVKDLLKNLLYSNNRYLILSECKIVYEELLNEIKIPMECSKLTRPDRGIIQDDLTPLYLIHVKGELEKDKCRIILKKLIDAIKRKKEEILLSSRARSRDEVKKMLELKIEDAYLTGANNFLRKEKDASKKLDTDVEKEVLNLKIKQTEEEIMRKSDYIECLITATQKVLTDIRNNREETSLCVKKLTPYIYDLRWTTPMTEDTNFQEVDLFRKFPVEYNRKFKYIHLQTFYNSICDTKISSYIKTDSDKLQTMSTLLNEPFTSAENVVFDLVSTKVMLNQLKSVDSQDDVFADVNYNTYTTEELLKREEYIDSKLVKLSSIMNSSSVNEVLSGPNHMEEITSLFREMPFKNFISDKRQVDGHGFKFYQKIFEELKRL